MTLAGREGEDLAALIAVRGEELPELMAAARTVRAQSFGTAITYSPNVFVPLTTLCRDVCHYCTFARPPQPGKPSYMTIEQVLELAERGRAAGCREVLFTLGDKPELRYRQAREELAELGCATTLEYLQRAAAAVLEQTGLLPHLNPGVVEPADLDRLRALSASMGIMLECSSERLLEPGMPHHGSPDKEPRRRLATIEAAGRAGIPFTSGILIGIGETVRERVEALLALRELHEAHGHIQEVIVQNFRAKPGTPMAASGEPGLVELMSACAIARLVMGPAMSIQAPPNLSADYGPLLLAGINDWGGVSPLTPDFVNPQAPCHDIDRLGELCADAGYPLRERLTIYPEYLADDDFVDPGLREHVRALADDDGLARAGAPGPLAAVAA